MVLIGRMSKRQATILKIGIILAFIEATGPFKFFFLIWSELAKILGKNVTLAKCPPLASPRVAIFEAGVGKGHPKGGPCRSMRVLL